MPIGQPDAVEPYVDRLVREAIDAGRFEALKGVGEPIPGVGTRDDQLWWLRNWVRRNRDTPDQATSNPE
jgi:hypothetical protein